MDFAYAIHSDVGDHCVAAKVNGEAVALRTELRSGDVVEIMTAPGAKPNPAWLNLVRTGRARSKIRHYLKTMEQDESRAIGEKMLAQALRAEGLVLPDSDPTDDAAAALWQQLTRWSGNRTRADLMVDIALGPQDRHHRRQAPGAVDGRPRHAARRGDADARAVTPATTDGWRRRAWSSSTAREGASVQLATCCRPIPGDASSATWAAARAWWCTPPSAMSASDCSSATASAGCRSNGPRS